MISRRNIIFLVISGMSIAPVFAITDPAEKYPNIDLYLEKSGLVWTKPDRFKPRNINLAPRDIAYRKKVLPFEQDRYADTYLVIPQLGLVAPIQHIPVGSADSRSMIDGHEISINKYLQNGIIEYAGSVKPGYVGKRIDFGHSNYFASDTGRYRTIFANLMRLDAGDEVRYFEKNGEKYDLFRYTITASYPTKPSNTEALLRDGKGADALIFGCYHGLDGRWMIEATTITEPIGTTTATADQFKNLPAGIKTRIDAAMSLVGKMPMKRRAYHLVRIYQRVETLRKHPGITSSQTLILDYVTDWVARLYE